MELDAGRCIPTPDHSSVCHRDIKFGSVPVSSADETGAIELDETVSENLRYDRLPVKLEKRGVTSHHQGHLWFKEVVFKESIVARLNSAHRQDLANRIASCHTQKSVRLCIGCKKHSVFWNRCDIHWCPICSQRLAYERRQSVEWWTKQIKQPKHVVLTARNGNDLKTEITRGKQALSRLRRRKFAANWVGGFYRLEITNESRGWHVHFHLLVDARWIDAMHLSKEWGNCLGQDIPAIVKVKDCRESNYLVEVTKYSVKASDLSSWTAEQQIEFIEALDGVRTFGVFGSLYKKRTEWKEFLDEVRAGRVRCECGCDRWKILSEQEFEWETEITQPEKSIPPPRLQFVAQPELALGQQTNFFY